MGLGNLMANVRQGAMTSGDNVAGGPAEAIEGVLNGIPVPSEEAPPVVPASQLPGDPGQPAEFVPPDAPPNPWQNQMAGVGSGGPFQMLQGILGQVSRGPPVGRGTQTVQTPPEYISGPIMPLRASGSAQGTDQVRFRGGR